MGLQKTPNTRYPTRPPQATPAAVDSYRNLPIPTIITMMPATNKIVPMSASQCLDEGRRMGVFFLVARVGSRAL